MDSVPQYSVEELIFFPGKELCDANIAGKRMPHRQIRIAIGVEGVYKFESDEDKLITFWSYSDIADWSYSGYSFTLNLKSKVDYHVRTNDGPSISQWIESFRKSPDQAKVASRDFKALGDMYPPINKQQPVFYTLNNRKRHNRSSETHSRLLSAYGVDHKPHSSTHSIHSPEHVVNGDFKRWSTGYSGPQGNKKGAYRSASTDILDKKNDGTEEARARSMECLSNGYSSSSSPVHRSGNHCTPPSATVSPVTITTTTTNVVTNSTSNGNGGRNDKLQLSKSLDLDDETPPIAPPRITSLKPKTSSPLIQTTPPKTTEVEQTIKIKVSDIENQTTSGNVSPHTYEEIEIGVSSKYNRLEILPKSMDSDYDHLFPGKNQGHKIGIRRKKSKDVIKEDNSEKENKEEVKYAPSIRRNESLPPMTFNSPLMEKRDMTTGDDESGVSDSEIDEPVSPLPGEYRKDEGVVMRQKPDNFDPFADLLSAPPNKSHLRWSQELNPIYDYIKGVKITPKIGYDSLATTPENVIQEEDVSQVTGDDTTSIGSSDRRSSSGSQFEGLVFVPQSAPNTLQRVPKRVQHSYEEVVFGEDADGRVRSSSGGGSRPHSEHYTQHMEEITIGGEPKTNRSSPLRRLRSSDTPFAVSPQLNKRMLHRKSKTVRASDDSNAPHGRQQARRVADTMRDFSYITREYRVFFVKMPTGHLVSEVVNINKPVSSLIDRLAELLGSSTTDRYSLFVEGAVMTTMKEAGLEFGELQPAKAQVNASSVSLAQLVDNNSLADQGDVPILLKPSLTFRVQGITTARILRLDDTDEVMVTDLKDTGRSVKNEFHKAWLSVVQGNQPTSLDDAVKLAALQYQAYFLERTAENSVIGFCRPTEFLPAEYAGVRAIEGKIYKEQEKMKTKAQSHIQKAYVDFCHSLPTSNTLFFPVREARRRLLHSAKLKPILLGINKRGIVRVCPKSKEVLESWEFQVLKNWAYSRRTFVIAFSNKNYPVESNQAKWISDLVDFHVNSIISSSRTPPTN